MALPSVAEMEAYIRRRAAELGIDPDVAVRVARSEGLQEGTWQANGMLSYGREQSYGPFQLHNAPPGERPGMGNDFVAATGLNPADPDTWDEGIDFALQQARKGGWGPWYGAKKEGITGFMGIGGEPATYSQPESYTAGEYVPSFDYTPEPGLLDVSPSQAEPTFMDSATSFAPAAVKILGKASKRKAAAAMTPPPEPLVYQPLQRITLKGLL